GTKRCSQSFETDFLETQRAIIEDILRVEEEAKRKVRLKEQKRRERAHLLNPVQWRREREEKHRELEQRSVHFRLSKQPIKSDLKSHDIDNVR
ncbi:hypothetical protein ADUPG1_007227, partial [Aduncisulcus paluster]